MKRRILKWLCFRCWAVEDVLLKIQVRIDDRWPSLGEITIHLYWAWQEVGMHLFMLWFPGSNEETQDALNLEYGDDFPNDFDRYSPRQREIILRRAEWEEAV